MKPIRVVVPSPINSPLNDMIELIPGAMVNIAPERRDDLQQSMQEMTIRILADSEWVAYYHSGPGGPEIVISIRTVEVLWCIAYAYVVLLDEVYANRDPADRSPADLTTNPVVRNAMALLRWAIQDWISGANNQMPVQLMPVRIPRKLETQPSVADEFCLCSTAFILHHELGHHTLKHGVHGKPTDSAESIDMERDADLAAIDWILGGVDPGSKYYTKRAAGTVVALLGMTARGVHSGKHGGTTHPRHFDRLMSALERYNTDPNAPVWVFATIALRLHLDNSAYTAPTEEFGTFRDCLQAYVDLLANASQ